MTLDPKGLSFTFNAAPGDYEYFTEMYFKAKAREEAEDATKSESDYSVLYDNGADCL